MIKTSKNMRQTVNKAAMKADGNSRRCDGCRLHPCAGIKLEVCSRAFREGFRKGAAWKEKQLKER